MKRSTRYLAMSSLLAVAGLVTLPGEVSADKPHTSYGRYITGYVCTVDVWAARASVRIYSQPRCKGSYVGWGRVWTYAPADWPKHVRYSESQIRAMVDLLHRSAVTSRKVRLMTYTVNVDGALIFGILSQVTGYSG